MATHQNNNDVCFYDFVKEKNNTCKKVGDLFIQMKVLDSNGL